MAKRFQFEDELMRAVAEISGIESRFHRALKKLSLPLHQDRGLGQLRDGCEAMRWNWEGLPDSVEKALSKIQVKSDALLMTVACEQFGAADPLDLPDTWQRAAPPTKLYEGGLLNLAKRLNSAAQVVIEDLREVEGDHHLADMASRSAVTIAGERHELEVKRSEPAMAV